VILADWNEKEVQAAAKDSPIQVTRHWPSAVMCRMTPRWEAMVKGTVATFGRLDAAYNNAGVQDLLAETAASPCDDYDRIMGINLRGAQPRATLQASRSRSTAATSCAKAKDQPCEDRFRYICDTPCLR
jgi:NAD(P)-dependent dehydrogenase (short-subunit alcohol dehydrogenase family)